MLKTLLRISCLIFTICLSSAALAKSGDITGFSLNNGLKIIVKENHRAPVVLSQLWYRVGSSDEPNGKTGISHALEHMMFEGTPTYPDGQFSKIIAEHGGIENASTNTDYTNYFEELAADKLATAFALEADRMQHLQITHKRFSKEMQVVMEERHLRTDDNPNAMTLERFGAAAYLSNPYHHLPIGWPSDIQHLTIKDVQAWYDKWYAPNNAILVVVGDVQPQKVEHLAKRYFGNIPKVTLPLRKPHPDQYPLGKKQIDVNIKAKQALLVMGYATPSVKTARVAYEPYALDVIAAILAGGDSARLPKELVRKQQIAQGVDVSYDPYRRYSTQFKLLATPATGQDTQVLQQAISKQLTQLKKHGINQAELTRVINQVKAGKIYSQDSIAAQAFMLGDMAILDLPSNEFDHYIKMISQLTPKQIQTVANKYFTDTRLTIATLHPQAYEISKGTLS